MSGTPATAPAKAVRLRNLTPHELRVRTTGRELVLDPDARPARVAVTDNIVDTLTVDGLPVSLHEVSTHLLVTDLPPPRPAVLLVVSRAVAAACPDRHDLVVPHLLVRNHAGVVVACTALARPPRRFS